MRVDWYYRHIFLSVLLGQAYAYINVPPYSYSPGIIRPYNHKKRAHQEKIFEHVDKITSHHMLGPNLNTITLIKVDSKITLPLFE